MRMNAARLASELKSEILSSSASEGSQIPSINEICAKYKVSPVTALKSVKSLESEGLVECIRGKGVFLKNLDQASGVWKVGLLTMDYGGGAEKEVIFGQFMTSAAEELRSSGRRVTRLLKEDLYSSDAMSILDELDGLIATFGCIDPVTVPKLVKWGRPVVVIQNESVIPYEFHQVIPNLYQGYSKAARLIVASGAKRLTTAYHPDSTHLGRMEVFFKAFKETPGAEGVAIDKIEELHAPVDMGRLAGRRIGEKILAEGKSLEAIFCPSDFLPFGILDCFLERGLKPGVDFKLIGYDNFEGAGLIPFGKPMVTSVDFPRDAISRQAVRLLLDLERRGEGLTHIVRVPCELFERASTKGV